MHNANVSYRTDSPMQGRGDLRKTRGDAGHGPHHQGATGAHGIHHLEDEHVRVLGDQPTARRSAGRHI